MRPTWLFALVCVALTSTFVGCGDDDATMDGGAGTDGGGGMDDGGADGGGTTDGGRDGGMTMMGCTEGCEWVELAAGFNHTCARRANGSIMCWGGNVFGQLGDGSMRHMECGTMGSTDPQDCSTPVDVRLIDDAIQVSARGGRSTCALREGGEVWCWGLQSVPPSVGSDAMPRRFTPELREGFTAMDEVSDGFGHMCARMGGTGVCIGRNGSGQIGNGDTMEVRSAYTVTAFSDLVDIEVATTSDFTCARTASMEVFCWGSNSDGQLGDGVADHPDDCSTGGAVSYDCSLVPVPVSLPKATFTQISLGSAHACAITAGGELFCWGANNYGQLGLGNNDPVNVPTAVPTMTDVAQVSLGFNFTCARKTDGTVWCWGDNEEGTVGDGSLSHSGCTSPMATDCVATPTQVMGIDDASELSSGFSHACATRASGDEVWCWGWNDQKQLGDNSRERRPAPVQVMGLD